MSTLSAKNFSVRTRLVPLSLCAHPIHGAIPKKPTDKAKISLNPKFHFAPSTLVTRWNHMSLSPPGFISRRFLSIPANPAPASYDTYKPPGDQKEYIKKSGAAVEYKDKNFSYFVIGMNGVMGAIVARNLVLGYLEHFSASADVLAVAKVEVSLSSIPEGKNAVIKWREINEANSTDVSTLKHPESDTERTKDPKWLVMVGVCTHLGCIPVGEAGDYGGWFCPCHGSHYDISGRIRKGPAPLNLEIPEYSIEQDDDKIVIG